MKLLIAEDERISREGIRRLIPPELFREVYLAENGLEALRLAREVRPDVILCDIRMPRMDGLQLASLLRSEMPDLHIIFISAYSDKPYLKGAIAVQAGAYLEKPIVEAELVRTLTQAADEIRASRQKQHERSALQRQADQFARQQLLWAILRRSLSPERLSALDPVLTGEVLHADAYLPVSIQLQLPDDDNPFGTAASARLMELLEREAQASCLITQLSAAQVAVALYGQSLPAPAAVLNRLENAIRRAGIQPAAGICVCVGFPCRSLDMLVSAYRLAHEQALWMVFCGHRMAFRLFSSEKPHPAPLTDRLLVLLHSQKLEEAQRLILSRTEELRRQPNGSPEDVRREYEAYLSALISACAVDDRQDMEYFSAFSRLSALPEMSRFLTVQIAESVPPFEIRSGYSEKVLLAQDYIRRNLSDRDLSVQAIAEYVGLTENYLSGLYKRETGMNLHRVIIERRMDRARALLLRGLRPREVAEKCGFSSLSYFQSAFRHHMGISPAEWVRAARRED